MLVVGMQEIVCTCKNKMSSAEIEALDFGAGRRTFRGPTQPNVRRLELLVLAVLFGLAAWAPTARGL